MVEASATKKKTTARESARTTTAEAASPYALDLTLDAPTRQQLLALIPQTAGSLEEQFAIADLRDAVGFSQKEVEAIQAKQASRTPEGGAQDATIRSDDLPTTAVALTETMGRVLAIGHYQAGRMRWLGTTPVDLALARALRPALEAYAAEQRAAETDRAERQRQRRLEERAAGRQDAAA